MALPGTADEPQNSPPAFAPPPGIRRPRSGQQIGLDGNPDPLRLGAGGVDAMPDGIRRPEQQSSGPR